jgi:hypothetical protein
MSDKERGEFEKHIKNCPNCQASIMTFNSLDNNKQLQSAPLNIVYDVLNKTTRKRFFGASSRTWQIGFAALASILLGVFTIFYSDISTSKNGHSYDISPILYEDIAQIDSTINEAESFKILI